MQSKMQSVLEALANTAIGLVIAIICNGVAMRIAGVEASVWQVVNVASFMTVVSVIRQYVLRRLFNRIKPEPKPEPVNPNDTGEFMALYQGDMDKDLIKDLHRYPHWR